MKQDSKEKNLCNKNRDLGN